MIEDENTSNGAALLAVSHSPFLDPVLKRGPMYAKLALVRMDPWIPA